jgi:hypothetical protein
MGDMRQRRIRVAQIVGRDLQTPAGEIMRIPTAWAALRVNAGND